MSYTPTTWEDGDTITAELMNKIEGGIEAEGPMVVNCSNNENNATPHPGETLDATFASIWSAMNSGRQVLIKYVYASADYTDDYHANILMMNVCRIYKYDARYRLFAVNSGVFYQTGVSDAGKPAMYTFAADSPSAYPTMYYTSD